MPSPIALRSAPLLLIAISAITVGYWHTTASLLSRWTQFDAAYGHGLLIVALSLWQIYRTGTEEGTAPVQPQPLGLLALLALEALWLVGYLTDIIIIQQLLWPLLMAAAALTLLGTRACKPYWFPLGFLYFSIPLWDYFNDAALRLTLAIVISLFTRIDLPTSIEGNSIAIPYGHIIVADGCSGLRYLIIGTALACYAAFTEQLSGRMRLALIVGGVLLGLLSNWVRVISLIFIGYYTQMTSPLMKDHEYYGWLVFFILVLLPLIIVSGKLAKSRGPAPTATTSAINTSSTSLRFIVITLLVSALAPGIGLLLDQRQRQESPTVIDDLGFAAWQSSRAASWRPHLPTPTAQRIQSPLAENYRDWALYHYVYTRRGDNKEIFPYISSLYGRDQWAVTATTPRSLNVGGRTVSAMEAILVEKSSGRRQLVVHWFAVGAHSTPRVNMVKLLQITAILRGTTRGDYYALTATCMTDCAQRSQQLSDLLQQARLQ